MNQIILVGTIKEAPICQLSANGNKFATMLVEVERPLREGQSQTQKDIFQVTMWRTLAEQCEQGYDVGKAVGIRGRLLANNYINDEKVRYRSDIVAEKIKLYNYPCQ